VTIGDAGIDGPHTARKQGLIRIGTIVLDSEMSAKSISRSAGDQTKHGRRIDQGGRDFVQRSVSTDSHHMLTSRCNRLPSQLSGVPRVLRQDHSGIKRVLGDKRAGSIEKTGIA